MLLETKKSESMREEHHQCNDREIHQIKWHSDRSSARRGSHPVADPTQVGSQVLHLHSTRLQHECYSMACGHGLHLLVSQVSNVLRFCHVHDSLTFEGPFLTPSPSRIWKKYCSLRWENMHALRLILRSLLH